MAEKIEYRKVWLRQVGRSVYSVLLTNPSEFVGMVQRMDTPMGIRWGWSLPSETGSFYIAGFMKRKEAIRHLIFHEVDLLPDGLHYESLNVLIDLFRLNKNILPDCPEA